MTSRSAGGAKPRSRVGLRGRIVRVVVELRRVKASSDATGVHDLRVAIRYCRSVAAVMQEVDGHPGWRQARRLPRKLFSELGAQRDFHVLHDWVERLTFVEDPLRARLLERLAVLEAGACAGAQRAAHTFDTKAWRRLSATLPKRARLVGANGLAAQCLALERFEDLCRLHARVARSDRPGPWHALRLAVKRFRYCVEILLPARSAVWAERLGRLQDLLGEIHDLDVLLLWLSRELDGAERETAESLRRTIARERKLRVKHYRQLTSGDDNPLLEWRAGLPQGPAVQAATMARLRATARAMDPHPRRTAATSRLALQLLDGLAASSPDGLFRAGHARLVLRTAALLHAIRPGVGGARHKAASAFLRSASVPPAWRATDWRLVAQVVRYQRKSEPRPQHGRFSTLAPDDQRCVRALAGVLRLARTLHRCRTSGVGRVMCDGTTACLRLQVAGVPDTAENAARLAFAKHLLEVHLQCPIVIDLVDDGALAAASSVEGQTRPAVARLVRRR